jgi:8-oxo-dGTP pyrophosphatase MutT (NUDIX family)
MAFPGGKRDPSDHDIMHTLVRETHEETSINVTRDGRVLGALEILQSTVRPELQVAPFVVLLERAPTIRVNEELEGYLWVSLNDLQQSETVAKLPVGAKPAYTVGDNTVWGLTYRILRRLLEGISAFEGSSDATAS